MKNLFDFTSVHALTQTHTHIHRSFMAIGKYCRSRLKDEQI